MELYKLIVSGIMLVMMLASCGNADSSTEPESKEPAAYSTSDTQRGDTDLKLEIAGTPVSVEWEDNEAVAALKDLCSGSPLEIQLSMYGGFEQVGNIGLALPRNDKETTTSPGDIVLYSGDKLVVFYGSNSWSYTRLGHITDSAGHSMEEFLSKSDVTIKLYIS